MAPVTLLMIAIPVFIGLAFLLARNALKGVRTGQVYVQRTRYMRRDEPTLFWLGVSFSTVFATASVAAIVIAIWALLTLT